MSEIPLHTFGRHRRPRTGYTALEGEDLPESSQNTRSMPMSVGIAAASASQGRRTERYSGDDEEEATLLGEHRENEIEEEEELNVRVGADTASQVRAARPMEAHKY